MPPRLYLAALAAARVFPRARALEGLPRARALEGRGAAYGQLCYWLRNEGTRVACPEPWRTRENYKSLVDAIEAAANETTSARDLVDWSVVHCDDPRGDVNEKWSNATRGALVAVSGRCPAGPTTWVALEVRGQSREVPYWLMWHMALGVSHFLVYDNDDLSLPHDALDSTTLRAGARSSARGSSRSSLGPGTACS